MDFFYHPILGLQFTCGLVLSPYKINLEYLPKEINVEFDSKKAWELLRQPNIQLFNSKHKDEITTNAIL